jgi:hypothetical protein
VQQLAVRPKQTELDKVIEALLLSFVLYLCVVPFFGFALPAGWYASGANGPSHYGISVKWSELVALALGALALEILYAANVNRDWALTVLRKVVSRNAPREPQSGVMYFKNLVEPYRWVWLTTGC